MKRPESQLYFEGAHILGAQAIVEKLMVSFEIKPTYNTWVR